MSENEISELKKMFSEHKKNRSKNYIITLIITVVGSCLISWLAIANTVVSTVNKNESRISTNEYHTGNLCLKVFNYNPYAEKFTSRGGQNFDVNGKIIN